jgi:predicted SprT family Zn-dependent metalloprotease
MSKLFDLDYESRTFKPTVEWMAKRYDEANQKLFNGKLGKCDFGIFTTGRGSRGGINGWFKLSAGNIRVTNGGTLIKDTLVYCNITTTRITHDNFYELARPRIELNGNKSGSEWAFMVTLVHEMCHYYTYCEGRRPARGHGRDFNNIARIVTARSDGQIEVTTHTTIERSKHFVMDSSSKSKTTPRTQRKRSGYVIVRVKKEGTLELTITSKYEVLGMIIENAQRRNDTSRIIKTCDNRVLEAAFSHGYATVFRTYRYWTVRDKKWLVDALTNVPVSIIYKAR